MSLFRWMFTRKCPQCHQQLDKGAKACRHCGSDNPLSWRKCMGCGASVAADSTFCWSCKANVKSQPRDVIFGDRWMREPGIFAMRVPIETPEDRLRHGIQVDEGVRGALYRNGVFKEELGPGYHTMTSFWERLTGGDKTGSSVEAIVCTADPVTCVISADETAGITTAGFERVTFAGVSLEVELLDLARMQRRFLPFGTLEVEDAVLLEGVRPRVIEVLRFLIKNLTLEQLGNAIDLRRRLEAELGRELPRLLENYGLRLCGVHDIILEGPALQQLHSAEEQISTSSRESGWEKRLRDIRLNGDLLKFKDEQSFNEQVAIWTHDYHLNEMDRRHLATMREIDMSRQQKLADAEARGQVAKAQTRHNLDLEAMEFENDMKELAALRAHQREMLTFLDGRKEKVLESELDRDIRRGHASTDDEVKRAGAFNGLRPEIAAGIVSPEHGVNIVKALEAMRPLPSITVVQAAAAPFGGAFPMAGGPPVAAQMPLETLAQRYLPYVGVVVVGLDLGGTRKVIPQGTVWVGQGLNAVVTNAHVAQAVAEACRQGARAWVIFSGSADAIPVKSVRIHPEYGRLAAAGRPIPSWDVALLELGSPLPGPGLPIASRHTLLSLTELQTVAYIGFPMEGLAGGGVNLERPRAIAKRGVISSLQDWNMRDSANSADRMLIVHDLAVAGGASGSPLFDASGQVIGIISAGNMEMIPDTETGKLRRIPSAAQLNFAQRVDALAGVSAM